VEPSSAAAWAGLLADRAAGSRVEERDTVVILLTGTGFKDVKAAEALVTLPRPCRVDLDSALRLLRDTYGMKA
jgi:threonine synthase